MTLRKAIVGSSAEQAFSEFANFLIKMNYYGLGLSSGVEKASITMPDLFTCPKKCFIRPSEDRVKC
jgi:hypothetical protein